MAFVISLDFELMWGVRDTPRRQSYRPNLLGARYAIPEILRLFRTYEVRATWAAVGMLLARDKAELRRMLPDVRPTYATRDLSPYENCYLDDVGTNELTDPYHFGYSLACLIVDTPGMELGTHTFSHYYCLERGQTKRQFEADLCAAMLAAERLGSRPQSIVFPRNQFNRDYLSVCASLGLRAFRGTELSWMYSPTSRKNQTLLARAGRLADNYLNLSGSNAFEPTALRENGIANIPASRFLRPYSPTLSGLQQAQMSRIIRGMSSAAQLGLTYHLWWHPHNFGRHTERNLSMLDAILRHYADLRERFGFTSRTMAELAPP
jgi:peptidoglycan/xylan/chitin deacetylase (PgdA/CDA1 family)